MQNYLNTPVNFLWQWKTRIINNWAVKSFLSEVKSDNWNSFRIVSCVKENETYRVVFSNLSLSTLEHSHFFLMSFKRHEGKMSSQNMTVTSLGQQEIKKCLLYIFSKEDKLWRILHSQEQIIMYYFYFYLIFIRFCDKNEYLT